MDERRELREIAIKTSDYLAVLEEMLEWFTNDQQQASWNKLISAVEQCGEKETADKMREQLYGNNNTPPSPGINTAFIICSIKYKCMCAM